MYVPKAFLRDIFAKNNEQQKNTTDYIYNSGMQPV